ncbi:PREDICTED: FAD-linked sulfhydryl oxidase ERV1-like [Ipomoea nil]|uniref:FAD-linked sulfhydryl oxidase ERV1-like n=1 Tax=Ipomoea nil TaxID=35883 RepID=UPI000900FD3E|nr:PREDICTED: FAD-linked sulfhydryl oxidase ERV1-like [Ipomoea nil]
MSTSENPLQLLFQTFEKISNSIQTHLSQFLKFPNNPHAEPLFAISAASKPNHLAPRPAVSALLQPTDLPKKEKSTGPVTKEQLGRATWIFLHSLAAQYPEKPTRQQKKDVKELMGILSRMYPCKDCADHFKEVLRANPVQAGSQAEFSQWLCHVHNVVNRSLGKPIFPCERVDARWGKLDCEQHNCDLQGSDKLW